MAERKGITSVRFWEACYMDEKEKNMDLEAKIAILEGDIRAFNTKKSELVKLNSEMQRELFETKKELERMKQEHEEDVSALRGLTRLLQKTEQKLVRAEDWIKGMKKGVMSYEN